jgi:hypothetical protein
MIKHNKKINDDNKKKNRGSILVASPIIYFVITHYMGYCNLAM